MSLLTFGRNKKNIFLFVCSNEQYAANDSPYFKFLVVVSLTCRNCVHWWHNFNHFVSLPGSAPSLFLVVNSSYVHTESMQKCAL